MVNTKKMGRPKGSKNKTTPLYDKQTKTKKKLPTKRVYICSPYKGDIERNEARARIYCRFAFDSGFVPIAPHLYYPQFLDESVHSERAAGMRYGLEHLWQCREVWVFGYKISEGMQAEIELAKDLKIPIKYYTTDLEER